MSGSREEGDIGNRRDAALILGGSGAAVAAVAGLLIDLQAPQEKTGKAGRR